MSTLNHTTVMLSEAVEALLGGQWADAGTYVDATYGRGGHSRLLLSSLSAKGRLIAFDKDVEAVDDAKTIEDMRFSIRHEGFANLGELPESSIAG
uniref:16S rRNA (cytosine(1402)-N(4))-methyltransferase n=1 Tax=Limnohabitans sp. Rim8 TaxID=1100718 RepID=UPI002612C3FA